MKKSFRLLGLLTVLVLTMLVTTAVVAFADTYYIKVGGTGDGSSWANASGSPQEDAFDVASFGDEVWVAAGTYTPAEGNRGNTFTLTDGVEVYGGFPNTGSPIWSDRDWVTNETVFSGDIGTKGDSSDNCYHVIYVNATLSGSTILDGFTIRDGQADRNYLYDDYGAGIYLRSNGDMKIYNCVIRDNYALGYGGGVRCYGLINGSDPEIVNCTFFDNSTSGDGGAISVDNSLPVIKNCTFYGNTASGNGDCIFNDSDSDTVVTNSILWNGGDEIYNNDGNSVPVVTYSDIWGGYTGTGNISGTPIFVNSGSRDFRQRPTSPTINSGSNSAASGVTYDFEKDSRVIDSTVDIGSDETTYVSPAILYVNAASSCDGLGLSWAEPLNSLDTALEYNNYGDDIWIAAGTYIPSVEHFESGSRFRMFIPKDGVDLYGGFPNTGSPSWGDRDWETYETILSGEIGSSGTRADNCYHVLYSAGTMHITLDGLSVERGWADAPVGPPPHYTNYDRYGGGIAFSGIIRAWDASTYLPQDIEIRNCHFEANHALSSGGGLYSSIGSYPILIENCTFYNNSCSGTWSGGALYNVGSLTLRDTLFEENKANTGGAISLDNVDYPALIEACSFIRNHATTYGGAIFMYRNNKKFANCLFVENTAGSAGPAIRWIWGNGTGNAINNCIFYGHKGQGRTFHSHDSAAVEITNCILWNGGNDIYSSSGGTPTVTYSDIQGGIVGAGNINSDPQWVNASGGDFRLRASSPCIGTGSNSAVSWIPYDFEDDVRIVGNTVDMGIDEYGYIVLKVSSGIGGSVTSPGEGYFSYNPGSSVALSVSPGSGYNFSYWGGSGTPYLVSPATQASNEMVVPSIDGMGLKANFEEVPKEVDANLQNLAGVLPYVMVAIGILSVLALIGSGNLLWACIVGAICMVVSIAFAGIGTELIAGW